MVWTCGVRARANLWLVGAQCAVRRCELEATADSVEQSAESVRETEAAHTDDGDHALHGRRRSGRCRVCAVCGTCGPVHSTSSPESVLPWYSREPSSPECKRFS